MSALLWIQLTLLLLLIVASAFFSSSETALFSLGAPTLRRWKENGSRSAKLAAQLMDDHHDTLVAILLGTNFVNILATVLVNQVTAAAFNDVWAPLCAGLIATTFVLIFGEVTPKTLAYGRAQSLAPRVAPPIHICLTLLSVPVKAIRLCTEILLRISAPPDTPDALTPEEYETYVELGRNLGAFSENEAKMFAEIFRLRDTRAASLMVPRVDIQSVESTLSPEQLAEQIRRFRHRYLPVVDDDLDHLVGILDVKAFASSSTQNKCQWLTTCVRRPLFVPELATADKVLARFRSTGHVVGIAVDEYGGICGMITSEDIIESIVGEILDEFDSPSHRIIELRSGHHWRLSGQIPLQQLADELEIELSESTAETLGGLLSEELGRIPRAGDQWTHGGFNFRIRIMSRHRVIEVDVNRVPTSNSTNATTDGGR